MKIAVIMLLLGSPSSFLCAQGMPVMRLQTYLFQGKSPEARFWTPVTITLIALDGAAKSVDSFATRKNLDGGGEEFNPFARPFVHRPSVQITSMALLFGVEIATAYVLHRRRHEKLGHAVLAWGALSNGFGATFSYRHRVPGW